MNTYSFVEKSRLSTTELAAIKNLVALCNAAEGIQLKFNLDMMLGRDGQVTSDILAYADDKLVGASPIDGFGDSAEITLAVDPQHRRQGVGYELYQRARQACIQRKAQRVLMVTVEGASQGQRFIESLGLPYAFSEYRMTLQGRPQPVTLPAGFELRPATSADIPELVRIFAECFGDDQIGAQDYVQRSMSETGGGIELALLHDQPIGQIGVSRNAEHGAYIRGVAVQAASRGHGYGRAMLATTVQRLLDEGETRQALDVETQNSNALGLYESCGFRQVNGFHYYSVEC